LPRGERISGLYYAVVVALAAVVCLLGIFGGLSGAGLAG
jgi:hypothetical protein